MAVVRDLFWLWGHLPGAHNNDYRLPGPSRIDVAEAAVDMGIPNALMVVYDDEPRPPFDNVARRLASLKRVVWSIIGENGSLRNDEQPDLDEVITLAERFPNITGAIMDDFFRDKPPASGEVGRYTADEVAEFARRLHAGPRGLDLWTVFYTKQLGLPVGEHLSHSDVVNLWTWKAKDLDKLEENLSHTESIVRGAPIVLGCYLYDYGVDEEMPVDLMEFQCAKGLEWLKEGRIKGMVFLASCVCDVGLAAVEWARKWIGRVGDTRIG